MSRGDLTPPRITVYKVTGKGVVGCSPALLERISASNTFFVRFDQGLMRKFDGRKHAYRSICIVI